MQTETDSVLERLRHLDAMERWLADRIAELAKAVAQPVPRSRERVQNAAMTMSGHLRVFAAELAQMERWLGDARSEAQADGRPLEGAFHTLGLRVSRARRVEGQWLSVHRLVLLQSEFGPEPLIRPEENIASPQAALSRAGDGLLDVIHRMMKSVEQDDAAKAAGAHADVPYPFSRFMAHAQAARRVCLSRGTPPPFRFLDVGCGVGLKVLAAQQLFETADGIEVDPGYARLARALLEQPAAGSGTVFEADAMSFEDYGNYDVIYLFQPIRDSGAMQALEQRIVRTARPDTLIVAPYRGFSGRARDLGCGRLSGELYVVGREAAEAAQMREKAEYYGPAARRISRENDSPWEPCSKRRSATVSP